MQHSNCDSLVDSDGGISDKGQAPSEQRFPKITGTTRGSKEHQEDQTISVTSASSNERKRLWNKRYAFMCYGGLVHKLPRHFEDKHCTETEVMEYLALPKGSKERRQKLTKLRNEGCFLHNKEVLHKGQGEMVVAYG